MRQSEQAKKCPKCGLFNPPSAMLCDCGYIFDKAKERELAEAQAEDKRAVTDLKYLIEKANEAKSAADDHKRESIRLPAGGEITSWQYFEARCFISRQKGLFLILQKGNGFYRLVMESMLFQKD